MFEEEGQNLSVIKRLLASQTHKPLPNNISVGKDLMLQKSIQSNKNVLLKMFNHKSYHSLLPSNQ